MCKASVSALPLMAGVYVEALTVQYVHLRIVVKKCCMCAVLKEVSSIAEFVLAGIVYAAQSGVYVSQLYFCLLELNI